MIIDTSAIMAILLDEAGHEEFASALGAASIRLLSAGSWIELAAVMTRGPGRFLESTALDAVISGFEIVVMEVSVEQARIGYEAYRKYGLGTKSPAKLNFGDCFAYALAKSTGEPLLFKGDDFTHTDITPALASPSR